MHLSSATVMPFYPNKQQSQIQQASFQIILFHMFSRLQVIQFGQA